MKIDFYHVDAMEAAHYEPLWRELCKAGVDAKLVAVPGRRNAASRGWFDFSRLECYYTERGIPFTTQPDFSAHAVTTQNADLLEKYRGQHIRLMYGPVIFPQAWGVSERAIRPFDAILMHGPVYQRLFSRWHRSEGLLTIGYPRFDDYFSGRLDHTACRHSWRLNPEQKTILYLPTWGENSSLDLYFGEIRQFSAHYNVLVKPHHCTLRFEPERMAKLERSGLVCPDSVFDLPALFACADLVIADIRSAAFCEAMALARPVVGLVTVAGDKEGWMVSAGLPHLAETCTAPAELAAQVAKVLSDDVFVLQRAQWAQEHVALRDGNAAGVAAASLVDYLQRTKDPCPIKKGYISRVYRLARQMVAGKSGDTSYSFRSGPDADAPYRTVFINELNKKLVDAARRKDHAYLIRHLVEQDSQFFADFPDEKIEVRTGLRLIATSIEAIAQPCTVVDIACGNCALLKHLSGKGYRVIGVDASPIRVVKNRSTVRELFFGMAEDLPLPDAIADVVVATEALEHVFDAERAVAEIARVLKPGGIVYCQVPEFDFADGPNHLRHFSADSLTRLFMKNFTVESVRLIPYLDDEAPRNLFLVARKMSTLAAVGG